MKSALEEGKAKVLVCALCVLVVAVLCCVLEVFSGDDGSGGESGLNDEQASEYALDSVYNSPKSSTADLHKLAAEQASATSAGVDEGSTAKMGESVAIDENTSTNVRTNSNVQPTTNSIGTTTVDNDNNTICTLPEGGTISYASRTVLVSVPSDTPQGEIDDIFEGTGQRVCGTRVVSNTLTQGETLLEVAYTAGAEAFKDAYDLSKQLQDASGVVSSEPNYVYELCDTENSGAGNSANDITGKSLASDKGVSVQATTAQTNSAQSAIKSSNDECQVAKSVSGMSVLNSLNRTNVLMQSDDSISTLQSTSINDTYKGYLWHLDAMNVYNAWDNAKSFGEVTVVELCQEFCVNVN